MKEGKGERKRNSDELSVSFRDWLLTQDPHPVVDITRKKHEMRGSKILKCEGSALDFHQFYKENIKCEGQQH